MIKEVLDFFDAEGVDLRKYPITLDSACESFYAAYISPNST
jgi:hypothetical protein